MRIGPNIYKRRDGRWEARVVIGKKANGKPQYKYLYAPTYREVSLAQKDFQKTVCFMIPASEKQKLLFQTAADEWLKQKRKSCKPSTYNKYKNYLDSYILLRWKNTPVGMITQETYDQLFTSLEETLSESSLRVINTVIKGCLKHALKSVPIDFKSIAATDSQVKILTDSEVSLLLYKLRNRVDLNTVGILFALYTGVRLGDYAPSNGRTLIWNSGSVTSVIPCSESRILTVSPGSRRPVSISDCRKMERNGSFRCTIISSICFRKFRKNMSRQIIFCPEIFAPQNPAQWKTDSKKF